MVQMKNPESICFLSLSLAIFAAQNDPVKCYTMIFEQVLLLSLQ